MSSTLPDTFPPPSALLGSEVILVVEDEAEVRNLTAMSLRRLGYFVLEAKHGEDALTVLHEYHGPVHLVVTDMVMPTMGGAELIRMLHGWYPEVNVLFVSAYSRELIENKGVFFPGARYLAKPFLPSTLAATVKEMLA
jgi:two-component system, cell cycle sensor histidine kinase and response regulator CckA